MNNALTRRLSFWFLAVISVAATVMGAAVISGQLGSMSTTLTAGTATAADVYVGQSLVVVGAALLGAGILGGLLTVAVSLLQPAGVPASRDDATAEAEEREPETAEPAASDSAESGRGDSEPSASDSDEPELAESELTASAPAEPTRAVPVG